jgi:hypothetical protein
MTRDDAIALLAASFARGSATPLFEPDRDAALRRLQAALMGDVITPQPAHIRGAAFPEGGLLARLPGDAPMVIAHADTHWLGWLPIAQVFFLAHGPDPGQLDALGFCSNDALAEWRG